MRFIQWNKVPFSRKNAAQGVAQGKYSRSKDNKSYALKGVESLKQNPSFAQSPSSLWKAIGIPISHNYQMDVVISLWVNNLIIS
ncbi:DUF6979 family protein [Brevibacillus sp. SYSU BS000544]|uniref:DUF6979 family protein n=1 Tax=Brevibacillus sp. SYSU BS000544 TaxID=3416443 RepID=UPI003CE537D7